MTPQDFIKAEAKRIRNGLHRKKAATPPKPTDPNGAAESATLITVGVDEHRVNADAIRALASEKDLYQRGGILVRLMEQQEDDDGVETIRRWAGSPVVRELPKPLLRERLTRCACWQTEAFDRNGNVILREAHPPGWCIDAVFARSLWPGIRHLSAVVTCPVLLPNGRILRESGYDTQSGILAAIPPGLVIDLPDRPTAEQVAAAVAALWEVVQDFPFERPEHRSAWLAGLLTPLAAFAYDGPAPMFLIDKNVRGAGAGLLVDCVALILTGRRFSTMNYTNDKEELRKKITSLAMEGERLILLDNLSGPVGNDVLDMALTTCHWKDRLLGGNRMYDGPLQATWYSTGNNVELRADTSRRVCHIRMESEHERPEMRNDVKYKDLRGYVLANRGQLLSAALTVLSGWVAAGRPTHDLQPWGSYEGWSGVVRESLVFAGLPDPGTTREALQAAADVDRAALEVILSNWEQLDNTGGMTAASVVKLLKDDKDDQYADFRTAVEELCGKLCGRTLGNRLRQHKRRNIGGKMIDAVPGGKKANRWRVLSAQTVPTRDRPPSPPPPPCPAASHTPCKGGEGGEEGQFPPGKNPEQAGPNMADVAEMLEKAGWKWRHIRDHFGAKVPKSGGLIDLTPEQLAELVGVLAKAK